MIAIPAMSIFFLKHSLLLSDQLFSRTFTYLMYFSVRTYLIVWSTVLQGGEEDFVPGDTELLKNIKIQAL